jgi:hypothetical protein
MSRVEQGFIQKFVDKSLNKGARPAYRQLVTDLIIFRDSPKTDLVKYRKALSLGEAFSSGLLMGDVVRAEARARQIYPGWLQAKHQQQEDAQLGRFIVEGGTDPVRYLGDRSGSRDLGYLPRDRTDNNE